MQSPKAPHAGQYQPLSSSDSLTAAGKFDVRTTKFQCTGDTQQITDAVIHHHGSCGHCSLTEMPASRKAFRISQMERR